LISSSVGIHKVALVFQSVVEQSAELIADAVCRVERVIGGLGEAAHEVATTETLAALRIWR
jgi:hypothetical protein